MKSEILRLLKESDDYISGQQMCDRFHVSRTAVWKAIEQLKKEGYEIEAVRNRGYRLLESPDIMSEAEIRSLMDTEWAGKNIVYFDEIDSTNNRAKELGEKDGAHGTLFVADRQVAGKGRRGRVWESPKGISIYMTILLRPDLIPTKAPMLTLVMAQSVAEGIREVTGMETGIKWPNDIVMNGKKVCGILTEMSAQLDYINHVVIGIGINGVDAVSELSKAQATGFYGSLLPSPDVHGYKSSEMLYNWVAKDVEPPKFTEVTDVVLITRDNFKEELEKKGLGGK